MRLVEGVEAQAITGTTNGDKLNADLTISQGQTIAAEPESQWQAGFEARGQVATEFATSAGGTALMAIYGFRMSSRTSMCGWWRGWRRRRSRGRPTGTS